MKINEDQVRRTSYLFRACSSKGVSYQHLNFGRDSKAGREVEKFMVGDRGGFRPAAFPSASS